MGKRSTIQVIYDLSDVLEILREAHNKKLYDSRRIKLSDIDDFLYSGRFKSVLGVDGFRIFKSKLKELIVMVNKGEVESNIINLDEMFEILLDSGVYYVDEHLPEDLDFLKTDERWLTAYRYIAKHFPDISYRDFRIVVSRFKDTMGYAMYVEPSDSNLLKSMGEDGKLFEIVVDVKSSLMQLSLRQLREICENEDIDSARSIEETADRIVEKCGPRALQHIPEEFKGRRSLIIKDQELATGNDILQLDSYLRAMSRVVREDLVKFVVRRRQSQWFS